LLALATLLGGCANFYVDTALKDVPSEQILRPAAPRPVQLVFEFRTNGTANASGTAHLKAQVAELVTGTGLFSEVIDTPVDGDRMLNIVLDNIPVTDNAFGKGFVTGMTFGLAGNTVTDGYLCTLQYFDGRRAPPIVTSVRHAIHATVGAESAPANAVKAASIDEAVRTMARQIVRNALRALSEDPGFRHSARH